MFGGARMATSVTKGGFIRTGFAKAEFFTELAAGEIAVLLSLCGGRRASCVFAGLGALWVATFPGDGTRIRAYRDLYDESSVFSPVWSGWADSNCRSPAPKAGALPLGHTPLPGCPDNATRRIQRSVTTGCRRKYPRGDSNSGLWLRRPALYPLSYGGISNRIIRGQGQPDLH